MTELAALRSRRSAESGARRLGSPASGRALVSWGTVLAVARRHRRTLLVANVAAVLAAVLSVPVPLVMPLLVDEVLLGDPGQAVALMNALFPPQWQGPVSYVLALLVLTLVLRLSSQALGIWQVRKLARVGKDISYRLRRLLLHRLGRVSMAEFETLGGGAVASRLVTDLDTVDEFVGVTADRFVVAILSILGTAAVLLWMHWQLALFILLANPGVIYLSTALGRRMKRLKRKQNRAYELFQEALTETLEAMHQIRASNRERPYVHTLVQRARAVRDHSANFAWQSEAANRVSFLVFLVGIEIFRAASMLMVVFSDLTVGQMIAVFGYLWFMMGPVQEALGIQYAYHSASAALERLAALGNLQLEPRFPHTRDPFHGCRGVSLRLEGVSFGYGDGPPVLNGLDLSVAAGERVAIVGVSGAGKTTLVQVLLGLYPPRAGMLYFGGVPVTEIGLDVVREHVGTVLQHPAIFNASVRDNLCLGRAHRDAALWQALRMAQLAEVVAQLPGQLDAVLGRDGVRLSGGQRQRLAIARLALGSPRVVILDEATSALDVGTEARVHEALETFLAGRTVIIVAHRSSAVLRADRICVFAGGRIVEQGVHSELLDTGHTYQQLYGTANRGVSMAGKG